MIQTKHFKIILVLLFFCISILISINFQQNINFSNLAIGLCFGCALTIFCLLMEQQLTKFNLLSFNSVILGSFVGFLLGKILVKTFLFLSFSETPNLSFQLIKSSLMLFGMYLGILFTLKNAHEIYFSIPFVRIHKNLDRKKSLLLDKSVLSDPRIIDLAATGLVDNQLIVPKFILNELKSTLESSDELVANKSKRCLDVYTKLESTTNLNIRLTDSEFSEIDDINEKMIRVARFIDANVLTADMGRIQTSEIEGIRIINIHSLSNALKPLMQTGEHLRIKIQRYGKEPRQGVGYLEDGTMVVVNGGGDFVGETINVLVLSVKHTSSGRMIFCNAIENNTNNPYSKEENILAEKNI